MEKWWKSCQVMSKWWQSDGKWRQSDGNGVGKEWQSYGKGMAKGWKSYGKWWNAMGKWRNGWRSIVKIMAKYGEAEESDGEVMAKLRKSNGRVMERRLQRDEKWWTSDGEVMEKWWQSNGKWWKCDGNMMLKWWQSYGKAMAKRLRFFFSLETGTGHRVRKLKLRPNQIIFLSDAAILY